MGWWRVSFVCPTGWEDDFASALRELTGAPTCSEPLVGAALCGRPGYEWEPAEGLPYGRLLEQHALAWTSLPNEPSPTSQAQWKVRLRALAAALGVATPELVISEACEDGWLDNWKNFFSPVTIGGRLVVRPPWAPSEDREPPREVIIRPGLAFGTGLHATTKMCLEFLAEMVKPDDVVLDLGAGSGILSIAACKLGARLAVAVDNDLVALGECHRNCQENGVAGQALLLAGPLLAALRGRWDILVCNIDALCACNVAHEAGNYLVPDGVLILAGFTHEKEEDVRGALAEADFEVEDRRQEGLWVCLSARRAGAV